MRHLEFQVAGVTFRRRESLGMAHMAKERDVAVRLVPEPDNKFDRNAIRVEMRAQDEQPWEHVGYVPRAVNEQVGRVLRDYPDAGVAVLRAATLQRDADTPTFRIVVAWDQPGVRAFTAQLQAADNIDVLVAVGQQIYHARRRGLLTPPQVEDLRRLYAEQVARLRGEE